MTDPTSGSVPIPTPSGPNALAFEVTVNGKIVVRQNLTGLHSVSGDASGAAALAAEKLLLDWHSRLTTAIAEALRHD